MTHIEEILKEISTILNNMMETDKNMQTRIDRLEKYVDIDAESRNVGSETGIEDTDGYQ
jgi:hypothetical protein|tara:strand:+ start:1723 stop:1899 length:177 start_codon:yes stop_codon:yes gene_type:complete